MKSTLINNENIIRQLSITKKVSNLFYSAASFAFNLINPSVSNETINHRKKICVECEYRDIKGEKLYRMIKNNTYACGVPFFKKMLRDPQLEGCGCYLNLKWKKKFTHCPNDKW